MFQDIEELSRLHRKAFLNLPPQIEFVLSEYQEYISSRYYDWMTSLQGVDQAGIQSKLEASLMCRPGKSRGDATVLESNFDKLVLTMFSEVEAWKRFQGEHPIPYIAHDIMGQQENLRILRDNVMLVVRDYNEIMEQLDPDEKKLFQEHIKRLDKRVNAGLLRFNWASKGVIEWYVKDCRKNCSQTCNIVLEFKKYKGQGWSRACDVIGAMLAVRH